MQHESQQAGVLETCSALLAGDDAPLSPLVGTTSGVEPMLAQPHELAQAFRLVGVEGDGDQQQAAARLIDAAAARPLVAWGVPVLLARIAQLGGVAAARAEAALQRLAARSTAAT